MPVSPDPKVVQCFYNSYTVQYKNKLSALATHAATFCYYSVAISSISPNHKMLEVLC